MISFGHWYASDDWLVESLIFFYSTGAKSHKYRIPRECGFRVGGSCWMIEWLRPWYSSNLQERRATSIGFHGNMVSVWEALVCWLCFYSTGVKSHLYQLPWEHGVRVGALVYDWVIESLICFYSTGAKSHKYRLLQKCGVHVGGSCVIIDWFCLLYATIPQERRATSIGYHGNMVSVWEALVWWLSDLISDMPLFHRSVAPQVSATTGMLCPCGRFLSDDWVI